MKILHLCSNFFGSNIYRELAQSLDEIGIDQFIYAPINKNWREDCYKLNLNELNNCIFICPKVYSNIDRMFYTKK